MKVLTTIRKQNTIKINENDNKIKGNRTNQRICQQNKPLCEMATNYMNRAIFFYYFLFIKKRRTNAESDWANKDGKT